MLLPKILTQEKNGSVYSFTIKNVNNFNVFFFNGGDGMKNKPNCGWNNDYQMQIKRIVNLRTLGNRRRWENVQAEIEELKW